MSLTNSTIVKTEIKSKLFETAYVVSCFNKLGLNDISKYAESYFQQILNIVFQSKGYNLKTPIRVNQDTYDLYDEKNKVCIQITSNNKLSKKRKTIELYLKYHSSSFEKLIILFISDKKPKDNSIDISNINFEDFNIIEFADLIDTTCNPNQLIDIRDILYSERQYSENKNYHITTDNSIEEYNRIIKLKQKIEDEIVVKDAYSKIVDLRLNPYKKFGSYATVIRSIDDKTYPEWIEDKSNWFKGFIYDYYEYGLLIWLDAHSNPDVFIHNKTGKWFSKYYYEKFKVPKNYEKFSSRLLAKLPFTNIIDCKVGDDYHSFCSHLFCKYDGTIIAPFNEYVYITKYDSELEYSFWVDLDDNLKIEI